MNQKKTYQVTLKKNNTNATVTLKVEIDTESKVMWRMEKQKSTNEEIPVRIYQGEYSWRQNKEQARQDMERHVTELEKEGYVRIEQKDRTLGTLAILLYMAHHPEYHTVKIYRHADTTADPLTPMKAVSELGTWIQRYGLCYGDWLIDNTLEPGFLHIYNAQ